MDSGIGLSVVIKALNEESRIEACLASVFKALAVAPVRAEVVVADALSTDRTPEIARTMGARVVQLRSVVDRGCGTGVQLGYQASRGDLVMFLDADMELDPDFLPAALAALRNDARLAGVAGQLIDAAENNWFDRKRVRDVRNAEDAVVSSLGGGGLFRRNAIEACGGYAGNRNLLAFEEAELGMRLYAGGWHLKRLAVPGVVHTGHRGSSVELIRRYWRAGRMEAAGVLLRAAVGKPWLPDVLRLFIHPLAVITFWCALVLAVAISSRWLGFALFAGALIVASALMLKKRSLRDSAISLMLWHVAAAGLIVGLFRGRLKPVTAPIGSLEFPAPAHLAETSGHGRVGHTGA